MALIVEDGTGLTTAESYLSVDDADTYHTAYGAPALWTAATTGEKETALRIATRYLDAAYQMRWKGKRTNETQRLAWPRSSVYDQDGYLIDDDDLPLALEDATAIAALKHVEGVALLPDLTSNSSIVAESKKVGPLEISYQYQGGSVTTAITVLPLVTHTLSGITWPGGSMVRG